MLKKEQIIEALLLWNFWKKDVDTGIRRDQYLKQINVYLKTDEIIALTGIRRSGKSTILLQTLAELIKNGVLAINTLYVNFEDPKFYTNLNLNLLDEIWDAYQSILKPEGKVYLVLDEVQKIKGWEHWVRTKYDQKQNVKIFVTGSNTEFLSSEFSSVLTGRHFQLCVTPLSFTEFLRFRQCVVKSEKFWLIKNKIKLQNFVQEYLQLGGFPKVVLTDDELVRKEILIRYFDDILIKDIVERFNVKDISKLKSLALLYGTNFTRKYNFHKIRKIVEVSLSLDSIQRFSHYLQSSFLVDFVPRFSYSLKNQMQTDRKIYLVDNGMYNAIAFKFSADNGKLLENMVFQHLKKKEDVYYFLEKQEVDFVCKEGLRITKLINVCYCLGDKQTRLREVNALIEGMKYFKLKESFIITGEGEAQVITEQGFTIHVVPFYIFCIMQSV